MIQAEPQLSNYPHIHRRRDTLYFRMWVPTRIRPVLGVRELTQSLNTQSYKDALPLAYKLASEAKILFFYIDAAMSREESQDDIDENFLRQAIEEIEADEAIEKARLKLVKARQQAARDERAKIAKDAKIEALENENMELHRKLRKETDLAKAMGELEAYRKVIGNQLILPATQSTPPAPDTQAAKKTSKAPALSVMFEEFVRQYKGDGSKDGEANKTKLNAFGGLFTSFLGSKQIDQITQKEVNDFFRLLIINPAAKYPGLRISQQGV